MGDTDYKLPAGWSNENYPSGDGWLETDSSCVWWMEIDMVVPPTPGARRLQERRAVPSAGMSAAAALLEATGIDPAAPAQEQCVLGPTIVYEAGTTHPYYITPNLCSIGTKTYASKKTVRGASPRKVCHKFCEAASEKGKLELKHVQGLTCYCKRR